MKKSVFTIWVMCLLGVFPAKAGSPLTIYKTAIPPVIDGVGADPVWLDIENSESLDQQLGESPLEASFKMCWDDDFIYVLVSVLDDTPNGVGSTTYFSDCVEIYFAMNDENSTSYRAGDWQIRKVCAKTQDAGGIDGTSNVSTLKSDPDFIVEQVDDDEGYVQEWQFPIGTLSNGADFDGENFRFEMQVGNNNGESTSRVGQSFWNSTANDQWKTVANQGYVVMSTTLIKVEGVQQTTTNVRLSDKTLVIEDYTGAWSLYDITGQMLRSGVSNAFVCEDLSDLQAGVYIVKTDKSTKVVLK